MIGTLTRNTEPHEKCSSRKPLATGPTAAPPPEMPAHTAIALPRSCGGNTLVRIDSVAGMTNAAPRPMTARPTMMAAGTVDERREQRAGEEHREAGLQRALAAVPVADRAGGQQQAGEHQAVGIDHPLLGGDRRVELAGQRGQGHVERGVADDDDHQAGAQHRQDLPATLEHRRVDVTTCAVSEPGGWVVLMLILLARTLRNRIGAIRDAQPHSPLRGTCVTRPWALADATIG